MTVSERVAVDPADGALDRHRAAVRRQWRTYVVVLTVLVLAVAGTTGVLWSRSEIVHATLHSATTPPAPVPSGELSARPTVAWRTDEHTAANQPFQGGTVVTYSAHAVHGRDARTGAVTWSYTRTDRTVCDVVQVDNRTVAFFRRAGNCDEVNAFRTDTGQRAWDRTLDTEGHPVDGTPAVLVRDGALFVSTGAVLYAIRLSEGYDYWEYAAPDGCRDTGLAVGSAGALIAQACADGDHLLLRDRLAGNDQSNHPVKWRLDHTTAQPFAADGFVGALDPASGQLLGYDAGSGRVVNRLTLTPAPAGGGTAVPFPAKDAELVWWAGQTYALDPTGTHQLWTVPTAAPLTVTTPESVLTTPTLAGSLVLAVASDGVQVLEPGTGRPSRTVVEALPPGPSRAFPVGTGFVVSGASTVVYR